LSLPPENARIRHILLLTDGVSAGGEYDALLKKMARAGITLSTVAVGNDADRDLLDRLARLGGGQSYVVRDPRQLGQIFVREARTLRRPLIHQPPGGIQLLSDASQPLAGFAGDQALPNLSGIVLAGVKPDRTIRVPLRSAASTRDPVLAHWQIGLGRAAVFTGDATTRWAAAWVKSPAYASFWPQVIRSVARSPGSGEFEVRTVRDGNQTRLIVEAAEETGESRNFLALSGKLAGPDYRKPAADVHLQQTGPGRYEAILGTPDAGAYFAALRYQSPAGQSGSLLTGTIVPPAPELRDLSSNELFLEQAATATTGRVLRRGFDNGASLFDREGLRPSISFRPLRDLLLWILMGILLMDVAVRRIAWDWPAIKKLAAFAVQQAHAFLTTRTVEPAAMLAALHKVRHDVAEQRFRRRCADPDAMAMPLGLPSLPVLPRPPESRSGPTRAGSDGSDGGGLAGNLMLAKMRAAQVIREIEHPTRGPHE